MRKEERTMDNKLNDMMSTAMEKVREMVDTNTIVGQPITTPDGVTLIPISKVSFGFGSGGGDYGKNTSKDNFGGGSAAGVKIDPVAFIVIKDGNARVVYVNQGEKVGTVDRILDMVPPTIDKVANIIDSRKAKAPAAEEAVEDNLPDFEVEYYTEEEKLPKGEIL